MSISIATPNAELRLALTETGGKCYHLTVWRPVFCTVIDALHRQLLFTVANRERVLARNCIWRIKRPAPELRGPTGVRCLHWLRRTSPSAKRGPEERSEKRWQINGTDDSQRRFMSEQPSAFGDASKPGTVCYTVRCDISANYSGHDNAQGSARESDLSLAEQWLHWMTTGHIDQVLAAGAMRANLFELQSDDEKTRSFEVRYLFPSHRAFADYEQNHAPQLRGDGLQRFPVEKGLKYTRAIGTCLASFDRQN